MLVVVVAWGARTGVLSALMSNRERVTDAHLSTGGSGFQRRPRAGHILPPNLLTCVHW